MKKKLAGMLLLGAIVTLLNAGCAAHRMAEPKLPTPPGAID